MVLRSQHPRATWQPQTAPAPWALRALRGQPGVPRP